MNRLKLLGIVAAVATIGLAMTGCDQANDPAQQASQQRTVTFIQNHSATDNITVTSFTHTNGGQFPANITTPSARPGWSFTGYWTARSSGTQYFNASGARTPAAGGSRTLDSDLRLYAQWHQGETPPPDPSPQPPSDPDPAPQPPNERTWRFNAATAATAGLSLGDNNFYTIPMSYTLEAPLSFANGLYLIMGHNLQNVLNREIRPTQSSGGIVGTLQVGGTGPSPEFARIDGITGQFIVEIAFSGTGGGQTDRFAIVRRGLGESAIEIGRTQYSDGTTLRVFEIVGTGNGDPIFLVNGNSGIRIYEITVRQGNLPTPPEATVTGVTVSPASTNVARGGTQNFSAAVTGTNNPPQSVTWSIDQTNRHAQTTIGTNGVLSIAAAETLTSLTVRATSTANTTISGTATVTITAPAQQPTVTSVTISPASASVTRGQTQNFSATVLGTNNPPQSVTWSIDQTNRHSQTTIGANGFLSVAAAETLTSLTVRATSTANIGISGTATVTVTAPVQQPTVTSVTVSPASASVTRGQTQNFSATVLGTNNPPQTVTWSIDQTNRHSQTTIGANGFLSVAAAETLTSLTVRATSTANAGISGTAIVTVTAPAPPPAIVWTATPTSGTPTPSITLNFLGAPTGLIASDITINPGTGSAIRGNLTGTGNTRTLAISNVSAGTVSISIDRAGIASGPVTVTLAGPITWTAIPVGSPITNEIAFSFGGNVPTLLSSDIRITPGTGSATVGTLSGSGNWRNLTVANVTPGTVTIQITRTGISNAPQTITLAGFTTTTINITGIPATYNGRGASVALLNPITGAVVSTGTGGAATIVSGSLTRAWTNRSGNYIVRIIILTPGGGQVEYRTVARNISAGNITIPWFGNFALH